MWRFTMLLLCLIAALAGSPLRQAEAAGDLARSLAELDGGDVIEAVDGGVGDDAGETTLTASGRACAGRKFEAPGIDDGPCPAYACPSTDGDDTPTHHPARRRPPDPAHPYAWLQSFRF